MPAASRPRRSAAPKAERFRSGYSNPGPTRYTVVTQYGKKLVHEQLPETQTGSFLQLKFSNKDALLKWPLVTKWLPHKKSKNADEEEENQCEIGSETQTVDGQQTSQNHALAADAAAKNDAGGDDLANDLVPQQSDQAPIAPGVLGSADPTDGAFQAAATEPDLPSLAPVGDLPKPEPTPHRNARNKAAMAKSKAATPKPKSGPHTPAHRQPRQTKSILKPDPSAGIRKTTRGRRKNVVVYSNVDYTPPSHNSNEENESPIASSGSDSSNEDSDIEMSDSSSTAKEKRPALKLSFSRKASLQAGGIQTAPAQTPGPQSATARTPSIKLKLPGTNTPLSAVENVQKPKKQKKAKLQDETIEVSPGSKKKRKYGLIKVEGDDEGSRPAPAPPTKPPVLRKLTFKNAQVASTPAPKAAGAAQVLFKVKGKIPKRSLGVGYDSELETEYPNDKGEMVVGREVDPVIHEAFVLRMQPGDDADYLRKAIEDGKVGEMMSKGGTAVSLRLFDTLGRRGILQIRDHRYATSLVDMPCIIEGMKSWDKKGWIKSVDICQMLLVLGRCKDDDEARNYPLPEDVDPQTYQYAHGLTAPMKWVRKRRFARTKRARVDDIEAVERRVMALLEADKAALSSRYQLLDHDPRLDEHGYSTDMEEGEDEDEDDSDAEGEVDNYFDYHPGAHNVSTPMLTETPVEEEEMDQADVEAIERMFYAAAKDPAVEPDTQPQSTLQPPEAGGDSSLAITSTSATPSATAELTPAADATSDEENDDSGDDDEDRDDAEKEGDESKRQALERIDDMTNKIAEQRELLKKTTNAILKKKLAKKIRDLEDDVAMMKKTAGLAEAEEDE